jgi:DNA-binding IscR family transcriptional regulator
VLHVLADHADQYLLITNVGIDSIAEKIQVTAKTIRRCLPKLERAGLIVVKRRRRHGNMYMLLMGDLEKSDLEKLTEVFQNGLNMAQVSESLTDTLLSLRNGVLTDTPPAKSLKADCSNGQLVLLQ